MVVILEILRIKLEVKKIRKWELTVPRRNSPDPRRSDILTRKLLKGRDLEVLVKRLKVKFYFFYLYSNH